MLFLAPKLSWLCQLCHQNELPRLPFAVQHESASIGALDTGGLSRQPHQCTCRCTIISCSGGQCSGHCRRNRTLFTCLVNRPQARTAGKAAPGADVQPGDVAPDATVVEEGSVTFEYELDRLDDLDVNPEPPQRRPVRGFRPRSPPATRPSQPAVDGPSGRGAAGRGRSAGSDRGVGRGFSPAP